MVVDWTGRSPLHYAALGNDVELARSALTDGVDPNGFDRDGSRPLHFAAQQGAVEVAMLLLDAGADVDSANAHGNTPLFVAVFNSHGDGMLISLLRARGVNPFAANKHGQTPIGLSRLIANYPVAQFFADLE